MATGGSEETFEFICTPCSKDSIHAEAAVYCVECRECLCQKCFNFHQRLSGLILHKVLDKAGMQAGGASDVTSLPTDTCNIHPGKLIVVYCEDHDTLCCVECVAGGHGFCANTVYIPDSSNGFKDSQKLKDLVSSMNDIINNADQIKTARQTDLQKPQHDKNAILTEIHTVSNDLVQQIKALEQVSVDMVKQHYDPTESALQADIKAMDDLKDDAKSVLTSLSPTDVSDAQLFINEIRGRGTHRNTVRKFKEKDPKDQKVGDYHLAITSGVKQMPHFLIEFKSMVTKTKLFKAKLGGEFSMKIANDKVCDIIGLCLLPNGTMVLTDRGNICLKRLDTSYRVFDHYELPNRPWGITRIAPGQVAVTMTMPKKVQFVSVGINMCLTKSFSTSDKCRGICYIDGKLFVACGGLIKKGLREGPGHVSVYDLGGTHLRMIRTDQFGKELFSVPYHITNSSNDSRVYVSDSKYGVISLDRTGKSICSISDPSLKHALGVCSLHNDLILVGDLLSNSVIQFDGDGRKVAELLKDTDGVKGPQLLCYDSTSSKLIVSMALSDKIKVYDLV